MAAEAIAGLSIAVESMPGGILMIGRHNHSPRKKNRQMKSEVMSYTDKY